MRLSKSKRKLIGRKRRAFRTRRAISGTTNTPRLCVFRSLRFICCQAIDDTNSMTIVSAHSKQISGKKTKSEAAFETGKQLGGLLIEKNITKAVFDRGSYKYHGRVKAFADGIREAGVKF